MKTRHYGFSAVVLLTGALAISTGCADQPKPKCVTGRGEFAARFTYVSGPEACKQRKGELFGVQAYNAPKPDGLPDLDKVPIAIQSVRLAHIAGLGDGDSNEAHTLYAKGMFKTPEPGDDDLCRVEMTTAAEQDLPEVAASDAKVKEDEETHVKTCTAPAERAWPKMKVKYEWSDVVFYVTAAATGTQFKGRLKYTENADVCEWDVNALYPSVGCGDPVSTTIVEHVPKVTPDGDPTCRVTKANAATCGANAPIDLVYNNPVGSSINPDFVTTCEPFDDVVVHDSAPTQFICLPPAGKFPALR